MEVKVKTITTFAVSIRAIKASTEKALETTIPKLKTLSD